MFEKRSHDGYLPALTGIERKTLVHGANTLMTEFKLSKGSVLPRHSHPASRKAPSWLPTVSLTGIEYA